MSLLDVPTTVNPHDMVLMAVALAASSSADALREMV